MKKIALLFSLILMFSLTILSQIPTDGLIGYWSFTGNADDDSGNGNNGNISGAVLTSDRFGNADNAYHFDGVDDYIDLGILGGYSSHTFSGWFLIEGQQNGYGALVSKLYNDLHFAKNSEIRIDQNRGEGYNVSSQLGTGSIWEGTHIDIPVDSTIWHHFAYMYDDNEKSIKVYLDNELVDSIVITGYSDVSTTPTYVGARPYLNGSTVFFFHGSIDDVSIYNRSLQSDEIAAMFNEGKCYETIYDTTYITVYDTMGCQPENLALHQTYTASIMDSLVHPGHNPRFAFDNDTFSAWHPQAYPTQWIAVHFKSSVNIDSMGFWYGQDPGGSTTQEIYSTPDSLNWSLVETINPYHILGGGSYTHVFSDKIEGSKGIRIRTTQNPSWIQWKEIMIWGRDPEKCIINIFDTIPVYDTTFVTIQDTIYAEIFDTTFITVVDSISVTDTLVIDAILTGINPPDNINTLKVYPNPAKDHIIINTGEYTRMNGYQLKIVDQLGAIVFETNVEEPLYEVNLSSWTGMGLYYVHVVDSGGNIIDIRKIILQ